MTLSASLGFKALARQTFDKNKTNEKIRRATRGITKAVSHGMVVLLLEVSLDRKSRISDAASIDFRCNQQAAQKHHDLHDKKL